ncbi:MAG: hypothetical protein A3G34_13650 [Candidatus Lindowbacteria bacterium RIFCSPLOWO2_12_FULL_62_27]|nr:MAG: hypothetical protein A3I06_00410 [Candidatus Lindowbacteria bacterium RIFCSPLOWO2_02_FULL_62_12]OGH62624.1 MAG: hypothetical protein A3G34_13650 [Candidatus Lindowbacteria bacterium RIFCSPLOWO2_12_FULL_62_27]
MWKTTEGSTGRLIQFCLGYFIFYVITGVTVKYFTGPAAGGFPGMQDAEFLVYSTFGGSIICLLVVFARGWYRTQTEPRMEFAGVRFPSAYLYIFPSGFCTAVIIPTTTMMYMLPISVMVAMVIMRASVIVIGRIVDGIQIRQGILKKKVYQEENTAAIFAITAAGIQIFFVKPGDFDFLHAPVAMTILGSYLTAYMFRIYIMNYFKNTRPKGAPQNNEWFFAIEQIAASVSMALIALPVFFAPELFGRTHAQIELFRGAIFQPLPGWPSAVLAGTAFGGVAFFSVFIFMFKGRTATFANLVNRLTSLVAGTAATLLFALMYGGKLPKIQDWISLLYIVIAVVYLAIAERRRVAELAAAQELNSGAPK